MENNQDKIVMNEELLKALDSVGELLREQSIQYEGECQEYWDTLSYEDKLKSFYQVTKLIRQGDMVDHGSYRWVLYDVFGFGMDAYGIGMDSGYLDIHNRLFQGADWVTLMDCTRFEVIDRDGRKYSNGNVESLQVSFQDNDKTVKFFINGKPGEWGNP